MKKIAVGLFAGLVLFAGCQKKSDDSIQGKTADERLGAALAAYQAKLTSATDGWILIEYTTGTSINQGATSNGQQAVFAYYMQFADSNTVTMFSDFDSTMAVTPATSSYRVKAVQRPSLIFDTYSYIHVPCDPDPAVSKSPFGPGLGWGADFEFSFADNTDATQLGDTIRLLGNLNNSSAIMVKATKAQHDAYYNGSLANNFLFDKIQNYFKRVTVGGKSYEFTPAATQRTIDIDWVDGSGAQQSINTFYYFVGNGIYFSTPVTDGANSFNSIQNIAYNASLERATATINGSSALITGATAPVKYNKSSANNWYNAAKSKKTLYVSSGGFHVNGVDDAYGLANLTDSGQFFYAYVYYPGAAGGFDLFSPFFASATAGHYPDYAAAASRVSTFAGTYVFTVNPLTAPPAPVVQTNTLMADPAGFYFILKEDGTSYDMVITSDAKSWISWQLL